MSSTLRLPNSSFHRVSFRRDNLRLIVPGHSRAKCLKVTPHGVVRWHWVQCVIGPLDNQITLDHPLLVYVAARAQSSNDIRSRMK